MNIFVVCGEKVDKLVDQKKNTFVHTQHLRTK